MWHQTWIQVSVKYADVLFFLAYCLCTIRLSSRKSLWNWSVHTLHWWYIRTHLYVSADAARDESISTFKSWREQVGENSRWLGSVLNWHVYCSCLTSYFFTHCRGKKTSVLSFSPGVFGLKCRCLLVFNTWHESSQTSTRAQSRFIFLYRFVTRVTEIIYISEFIRWFFMSNNMILHFIVLLSKFSNFHAKC